jgi:SAM-dependent methyltransferase
LEAIVLDRAAFGEMIANQGSHWWFRGKRRVIEKLLDSLDLPERGNILEIGCGAGGNLSMLSRYGAVWALEIDEYAREYAARTNKDAVVQNGWLPDGLSSLVGRAFDVICLFDVLEHVRDDEKSLCLIRELLADRSKILITVPAYQWLFSHHDHNLGHFRRYNRKNLTRKLVKNGYTVLYAGYMNVLSLPAMIISRLFDRYVRKSKAVSGTKTPPRAINTALYFAFALETLWVPQFSSPFGGSVVAIAKKR